MKRKIFEFEFDDELGPCLDIRLFDGDLYITIAPALENWGLDFRHLSEYFKIGCVTVGYFFWE